MSLTPYMESGYYPHVKKDWRSRLRVCWRILWHGELFPHPETWYEPLFRLTGSQLSQCVKRAVEKVSREQAQTEQQKAIRLAEAQQWARTYLLEAGLYSHDMRMSTINFLIEWWVIRLGGTLA